MTDPTEVALDRIAEALGVPAGHHVISTVTSNLALFDRLTGGATSPLMTAAERAAKRKAFTSVDDVFDCFAPYHEGWTADAFKAGFVDYATGASNENKYEGAQAQAYGRGRMAGALCERHGL